MSHSSRGNMCRIANGMYEDQVDNKYQGREGCSDPEGDDRRFTMELECIL